MVIVLPRPWLESKEAFAKRLHLTFTLHLQMEQQLIPTVPMMMMMRRRRTMMTMMMMTMTMINIDGD